MIEPLFLLLLFIDTLSPVLFDILSSKFFTFGSLFKFIFLDLLNNFTKASDCRTDNFFSIILLAIKLALSRPTRILA